MTVGKVIDYMGINDKIKYGFLFKVNFECPNDTDQVGLFIINRCIFLSFSNFILIRNIWTMQ